MTGAFIQTLPVTGGSGGVPLIEGMSFNFAQTVGGGVPEPGSLVMLGSEVIGLLLLRQRKLNS